MKTNHSIIGKEVIRLEVRALQKLNRYIGEHFNQAVEAIKKCNSKVILSGVGKSGLIASKISSTLSSVGTPSFFLSANESSHGDLGSISKNDILILISNSGNTVELTNIIKFAKRHKIKLASIEDLISYRLKYEKLIVRLTSKNISFKEIGKMNFYNYKNKLDNNLNFAISRGKLNKKKSIPVRVISNIIKNKNILKNTNVIKSLKFLSKYKNFLLLIINNQNSKSKDNNINTLRYYGIGAQIIKDLNVKNMILISRSRKKIIGLEGFGLKIKKQIIIK